MKRNVLRAILTVFVASLGLSAVLTWGQSTTTVPSMKHVVIVFGENTSYSSSVGHMPYLDSLIAKYGLATNYVADTHPSIGNYLAWASGQIQTNDDGFSGTFTDDNIALDVQSAGLTWKDYVENINSSCPGINISGTSSYAKKHDPLAYFTNINQANRVCFDQFLSQDLKTGAVKSNALPNLSYLAPNLCNDAHDCSISTFDSWLQHYIPTLLASPPFQTGGDGLLIITFDEGSGSKSNTTSGIESGTWTGGQVETVVISPHAKAGFQSANSYHHESVLRLMEEALGLTEFPGASSNPNGALTAPINMSDFFTTGSTGSVTFTASSLGFPSTNDGSTSSLTVGIDNTTLSLVTPVFSIAGTNATDFSSSGCSSVAANSTCTLTVTFSPPTGASGTRSATLSGIGVTGTVGLTGTAVSGSTTSSFAVSPTSLTFHQVGSTKSVTVTNTSTSSSLTFTSAVSTADFTKAGCSSAVAAGSSCTITVTYTPTVAGAVAGTLTVSASGASPQTVSLTGKVHKL
ncbi:MAG: hypothetical protein DMG21_19415 [Acidobacteria bacterium]|nr:MAG: hypothetical protein DMG21_19415 [Acidobacteriota bacterium]